MPSKIVESINIGMSRIVTKPGMVHPFHIHGTRFLALIRNGKDPYPNRERFPKTPLELTQGTVRILAFGFTCIICIIAIF